MINRGGRRKIIELLDIEPGSRVWEIGPGLGAMSEAIIAAGAPLSVFEIDPAYCRWLHESLGMHKVRIVEGDAIKTWGKEWEFCPPSRVLGNLPYNAASAMIASFIENSRIARKSVFTVQDELGKRMTAEPGSKAYSSFSVLCQTACTVRDGGRLSPGSFYPVPRVYSRIVVLEPGCLWDEIQVPDVFCRLLRSLFASRRKTLSNNIIAAACRPGLPDAKTLRASFMARGIELSRRPETLTPREWVDVANGLSVL